MKTDVLYTGEDHYINFFYNKYYYNGGNARYYTFQIALNLLQQKHPNPIILETGCQRQEEDVGAGMSTSIFAEYISRYGGQLIVVDLFEEHLRRSQMYLEKWPDINVEFVVSDSVKYLQDYRGKCDLVYLDSLDYPIAENEGNIAMQQQAQEHCLNELLAVENNLSENSIVLIDDNQLSGGGKPAKAKEYLIKKGWVCLLDLQSTLWIKSL